MSLEVGPLGSYVRRKNIIRTGVEGEEGEASVAERGKRLFFEAASRSGEKSFFNSFGE